MFYDFQPQQIRYEEIKKKKEKERKKRKKRKEMQELQTYTAVLGLHVKYPLVQTSD